MVSRPSAITTSIAAVPIQTRRGLRATRLPTCAPGAVRLVGAGVAEVRHAVAPAEDRRRQNARRPVMASIAGSSVSIVIIATAMPIAPIGPRPAVPSTSASDRHSSAAITVQPEAKIAGPAVRMASAIASCLSSCLRSSSR